MAVRRLKQVEAAHASLQRCRSQEQLAKTLSGLEAAARRGQIDGLVYIVRVSEDDIRAGSAGSYAALDDRETLRRMAGAFDLVRGLIE